MTAQDMAREMAISFYYAGAKQNFKDWDSKKLEALAKEISEISLIAPIHEPSSSFKKGFFMNALKNEKLKLIKADINNEFYIEEFNDKKFTTLQLMAIMTYCINKISNGGVVENFEYVRMGEML